jgi:Domain of unknown function (DUF4265)
MDNREQELVKIVVNFPEPDLGVTGEGLWAAPLGNDVYELRNSPWHARNLNWGDWVKAIAPDETKKPVFVSVVKRSGHRTIHVFFEPELEQKPQILAEINKLGAAYENSNGKMYAVDCPPEVDIVPLVEYLKGLEGNEILEFRTNEFD